MFDSPDSFLSSPLCVAVALRISAMSRIDVLQDDRGLATCLAAAQIRPEWVADYKTAHGVSTLDDFVYMVTASEWEKSLTELVEGVASLKGNRIALARFKSAFECGKEALKQASQPNSKTQDEEEILPEGTMQQLNRDWQKRYNLQFEPWFEPSEQLRSRVYREWRKQSMSVIDAKKIKSMLHIATPKAKEQVELPGGLQLQFDKEQSFSLRSVTEYYSALRVLAHCWAWSGNYMVQYNGESILMCDLSSALGYADRSLRDCMEYGGGSLKWLERNDLFTRGKMATYVRRGWPASVSLHEALRECHLEWRSPAMMSPPTALEEHPRKHRPELPPEPEVPPVAKRARLMKSDHHKTVSMIKGGGKLCKPWNDGRGCRDSSCTAMHQCDVKLPSGAPCLSKKHTRLEHE